MLSEDNLEWDLSFCYMDPGDQTWVLVTSTFIVELSCQALPCLAFPFLSFPLSFFSEIRLCTHISMVGGVQCPLRLEARKR